MKARPPAGGRLPRELSVRIADRLEVRLEGLEDEHAGRAVRPLLPLATSGGRSDFTIRFTDHVASGSARMWPLPAGATDDGIWLADHLGRTARIPVGILDGEPVLVERRIDPGFFHVWVWLPLVRLALTRTGGTLVHAAGVAWDGERVAVAAWGGTGKTAVLLECLAAGADFIGDDWVALFDDSTVASVTTQINLNPSHRSALREADWPGSRGAGVVGVVGRRALRGAAKATSHLPQFSSALARAGDLSRGFGRAKVALPEVFPRTPLAGAGPLSRVVVLTRTTPPPEGRRQIAEAIEAMNRVELAHLDQLLAMFRHVHPCGLPKEWAELADLDRRLVHAALAPVASVGRRSTGRRGQASETARWLRGGVPGARHGSPGSGGRSASEFSTSAREVA